MKNEDFKKFIEVIESDNFFLNTLIESKGLDSKLIGLDLFDEYEINDNKLLSRIAKIFAEKYNTSIPYAVCIVRDSYLAEMILSYPEQVHHDDVYKLVDNVYYQMFK